MAFSGEKYLKLWMDEAETLDKERLEAAKSPVKYSAPQKQKNSLFQSGAFHDGYQFGDVTKTLLGTGADVVEDLQKGVIGIGEGVVDTGAYLAGSVGGLFGADDFKDNMQDFVAKDLWDEEKIVKSGNLTDAIFGPGTTEENSLIGQKGDNIVASGGQLLGTAALQSVGVPWFVTSGLTSFGNSADNAFDQGATYGEAGLSSLISAGAEILTEKLFGGSGLGEKGLIKLDKLTNGISNKLVKALADYGLDMASEGAEEVASQLASNLGSKLYREENLTDILFSEEAIDSYIDSFVAGSVMGGFSNASKFVNSAKSAVSDLRTPNKSNATPAPTTPENTPSGVSTPAQTPLNVDDLLDEAIARALNAPSDPISAAVEGFKATGTITNNQARDILNSARAVAQLIEQTGIKLPDTAAGRRAAVKEAVAQLAQKQAASPVDSIQNTDYDNKNTTGGMNYAEGLHQNDRAGSPGDSARGMAGIQSGDGSGVEGWGQHGQVAVDSGILRVSDELSAAQQKRGTPVYAVQDTSAAPERYEQALITGRSSDTANGWCVTPKSAQELREGNVRTFMNEGGTVGVGIASNGDVVAVFKNKDGGPPKAMDTMMPIAIEQGGDRLDCYGEGLVRVYARYGFIPVARVEFNAEYANEGWTPDKGTPYIYFMMHNGDSAANVAENIGKYPKYTKEQLEALPTYGKDDYDAAMAYRDGLMDQRNGNQDTGATPASSVGAAPGWFDPNTRLQYEHGTIPEGENPVRPDDLPQRDFSGGKVSYTARTVKGAEATPDSFVDLLNKDVAEGRLSYVPITNSATVQKAIEYIENVGWDDALSEWTRAVQNGKTGADLVATGALLLNNAARAGDVKTWRNILFDYRLLGTNTAQGMQALRILKTLDPSDRLYGIERSINQMVRDMRLDTKIEIDPELQEQYLNAKTEAERDQVLDEIQQSVADQLPVTWMEKWTALRYVNMLGNFRTQGRNIAGNTVMKLTNTAKNAVATGIEAVASKLSGGRLQRTKSLSVSKELLDAAKSDFANVEAIISNGGKYSDASGQSTDFAQGVQDKRQIFKFKPLEGYRKVTNWAMEKGDLIFSKSAYARALAGYLKANGVTGGDLSSVDAALLDNARLYAAKEAQEVTFRDSNWLSDWVSKVGRRKDTPAPVRFISEGALPFRKTPANVLVRAEEYSPLGILNSLALSAQKIAGETNLTQGSGLMGKFARSGEQISGAQVINSWAKTLTGTGLFGLGMLLSNLGCLSAGPGDDEREDDFESMNGQQNYAITLPGGINFTIDFATPSAIPILMGAELMQQISDGGFQLKDVEKALTSITEPMVQMSMLQGMNDTLENVRYSDSAIGQILINTSLSYLTQGMTNSLAGQLERTFEDARMTTYVDKDSPLPDWLQRTLGKASAKTPGWDYHQVPYINAWGEEEENPEWYVNGVYNLFSPSYIEKGVSTELSKELIRLNSAQSDHQAFPSEHPKYITVDGKRIDFTADQYVAYAKERGQQSKQLAEAIISNAEYKGLSDAEKAKAISCAYDYASALAKATVADSVEEPAYIKKRPEGMSVAEAIIRHVTVGTTEKYTNLPVSTADYVDDLLKGLQKETKSDGSSYTNVRDIQKLEAVVSDDSLSKYVDDLLRDILQAGPEAKYDKALDAGYTPAQFVEGYRQYLDIEGKNKKQSIIRYCQREMGMSYAAAKKLCDIYYSKATEE